MRVMLFMTGFGFLQALYPEYFKENFIDTQFLPLLFFYCLALDLFKRI